MPSQNTAPVTTLLPAIVRTASRGVNTDTDESIVFMLRVE
jgi:hypothetical protein